MPETKRKVAVTVILDADVKAELEAYCAEERRTVGPAINFILSRWFKSRAAVEDLIWALYCMTPRQMAEARESAEKAVSGS